MIRVILLFTLTPCCALAQLGGGPASKTPASGQAASAATIDPKVELAQAKVTIARLQIEISELQLQLKMASDPAVILQRAHTYESLQAAQSEADKAKAPYPPTAVTLHNDTK